MRTWAAFILGSATVIGGFSATTLAVRWLNADTAEYAEWHGQDFRKKNGQHAIYNYNFQTNFFIQIGAPTNRQRIEFGFRDDGVVVWKVAK